MFFPFISSLFGLACAGYAFLDLQLIRGLRKLKPHAENDSNEFPSITVLIAARDEENNLPRLLRALSDQDYPQGKFHVLVVNDRSEDGTEAILRAHAKDNPTWLEY